MTHTSTPAAAVSLVPVVAHMLSAEGHVPILTFDKSRFLARDSFEDLVTQKAHLAALSAAATREAALIAERDQLRAAFEAACAFIDSHAADPDITNEMVLAYAEFCKRRAALSAPAVGVE